MIPGNIPATCYFSIRTSDPMNQRKLKPAMTMTAFATAASLMVAAQAHAGVGATTPFTSYEAEAGTLVNGAKIVSLTAAPTTRFASPELESSGHAYVALTGNNQEVKGGVAPTPAWAWAVASRLA